MAFVSYIANRSYIHEPRFTRVFFLLLILMSGAAALAVESWEMRVCGYPDSLPFMNRDEEGFENRIAEILASELGATVSYNWWPQPETMLSTQLAEGNCDILMGVPDGFEELLTTVAYYRGPYVFLQRAGAQPEISSLNDPELGGLRIGLQSEGIPPHDALISLGLGHQVSLAPGRHEPFDTVVEAVLSGEVDLGIAWGPVAGYLAKQHEAELRIVPVTPQFVPPFLSMVRPMVIGVRPGDEALRDQLNVAIVKKWEEIQETLKDYGVITDPLSPPALPSSDSSGVLTVGLVTPTRTNLGAQWASLYEVVGEAAVRGALLAESDAGQRGGIPVHLRLSSAPSAAAAKRAAMRLAALDNVDALVGGLGTGQAERIQSVAYEAQIPFLNIGDSSPTLRTRCSSITFHIEPRASSYLYALIDAHILPGADDATRVFVVHEDNHLGSALLESAEAVVAENSSAEVVGSFAAMPEEPNYGPAITAAVEHKADVILLLLGPRDQIPFLAQHQTHRTGIPVAPYPHAVTQSRDFLAAARFQTGSTERRVASWDPSLEVSDDTLLNQRFVSRWGTPMDASAWLSYAAVSVLHQAAVGDESKSKGVRIELIDAAPYEVGKGEPVSFDGNGQLLHSLYQVELDPTAPYSRAATALTNLAHVSAEYSVDDLYRHPETCGSPN